MRREERVTVQGPVKEQQPDGMSNRGGGGDKGGAGMTRGWCLVNLAVVNLALGNLAGARNKE